MRETIKDVPEDFNYIKYLNPLSGTEARKKL